MLHVNIIMLPVDNYVTCNISMLHVYIIYLACKGHSMPSCVCSQHSTGKPHKKRESWKRDLVIFFKLYEYFKHHLA